MFNRVKSKLNRTYQSYLRKKKAQAYLASFPSSKKSIFVLQTPTHSNIGDHAIAQAEFQFLKENHAEYNHIEINQNDLPFFVAELKPYVRKGDVLMLHGGGNFGNQYMREENLRRLVLSSFPNNAILIFPQTIYYTDDEEGRLEFATTKHLLDNHQQCTLIARERVSYDAMKTWFPTTRVLLTPDIVLYMDVQQPLRNRSGALMVMRGDVEKILTDQDRAFLDQFVAEKYGESVTYSDMHYEQGGVNRKVTSPAEREAVLTFKFDQFKSSSIVITDRLHGMVVSAITGTPCIAFSNYNQKVSGTYDWIKHLNYIKFVSNMDEFLNAYDELHHLEKQDKFDPTCFSSYYQEISNLLKNG